MNRSKDDDLEKRYTNAILSKESFIKTRPQLTPFFVTLCEGHLSISDIEILLSIGIKIVRFKMGHVTKLDMFKMLDTIHTAVANHHKNLSDGTQWPLAISFDLPNACIRTGALKDEILEISVDIIPESIIELSSDPNNWNKCDASLVYIDDPYTIKNVTPGTEVSIRFGLIVAFCTEVVDNNTIKCRVARGGKLRSLEFVCFRGVKHTKPTPTKHDLDIIQFAKDFQVDVLTINSLRRPETIIHIRKMFDGPYQPLIMSTICEQEGLDKIDEIIKLSDGIILAREFLACEINNKFKMVSIQLAVSGKCRASGKPFYISGNILEKTMHEGIIWNADLVDITNGVLQGAGFILRSYRDVNHGIKTIKHVKNIAKTVEAVQARNMHFWRLCEEVPIPGIASYVTVTACALMAKMTDATVIIVPTVSGNTPVWMAQRAPDVAVLAVTTSTRIARRLQLYKGIIPIIYTKPKQGGWVTEANARINFAIEYGLDHDILKYGYRYVALRKTNEACPFADNISSYVITPKQHNRSVCK